MSRREDTPPTDERFARDLRRTAKVLKAARRVAVFSGAGVSKESCIATFRDPGEGLWRALAEATA